MPEVDVVSDPDADSTGVVVHDKDNERMSVVDGELDSVNVDEVLPDAVGRRDSVSVCEPLDESVAVAHHDTSAPAVADTEGDDNCDIVAELHGLDNDESEGRTESDGLIDALSHADEHDDSERDPVAVM